MKFSSRVVTVVERLLIHGYEARRAVLLATILGCAILRAASLGTGFDLAAGVLLAPGVVAFTNTLFIPLERGAMSGALYGVGISSLLLCLWLVVTGSASSVVVVAICAPMSLMILAIGGVLGAAVRKTFCRTRPAKSLG